MILMAIELKLIIPKYKWHEIEYGELDRVKKIIKVMERL